MCIGKADIINGVKVRLYDEENKSFIKTCYDRNEVKVKGYYRKKIYCELNNKIYNTQTECAKDLKITQSIVSKCLLGKDKNKFKLSYF